MADFGRVRDYALKMDLTIRHQDEREGVMVLDDPANGIEHLVAVCDDPILTLQQWVLPVPAEPGGLFLQLLQLNAELVHGAFVVDEKGSRVFWRHTLQLEHLDFNEFDAAVQALSLAMAEAAAKLLDAHQFTP